MPAPLLFHTGPKSSQGTYHAMYMCVVPSASEHVWNPNTKFVDEKSCPKIGRQLVRNDEEAKHLPIYPLQNIVFYTQIPHFKNQVMSREFEFLLADLGIHFVFSQYLIEAKGEFGMAVGGCRDYEIFAASLSAYTISC
jgi:hypothetical protein